MNNTLQLAIHNGAQLFRTMRKRKIDLNTIAHTSLEYIKFLDSPESHTGQAFPRFCLLITKHLGCSRLGKHVGQKLANSLYLDVVEVNLLTDYTLEYDQKSKHSSVAHTASPVKAEGIPDTTAIPSENTKTRKPRRHQRLTKDLNISGSAPGPTHSTEEDIDSHQAAAAAKVADAPPPPPPPTCTDVLSMEPENLSEQDEPAEMDEETMFLLGLSRKSAPPPTFSSNYACFDTVSVPDPVSLNTGKKFAGRGAKPHHEPTHIRFDEDGYVLPPPNIAAKQQAKRQEKERTEQSFKFRPRSRGDPGPTVSDKQREARQKTAKQDHPVWKRNRMSNAEYSVLCKRKHRNVRISDEEYPAEADDYSFYY